MTITVVRRNRLGNDTEDITLFPQGGVESHIAIVDGYDVLNASLSAPPGGSAQAEGLERPLANAEHGNQPLAEDFSPRVVKLFDVLGLDVRGGPRGITYLESSAQFAFNDPFQTTKLFLAHRDGRPGRILNVVYPGGYAPTNVEGLDYVPPTSGNFPDHIIMAVFSRRDNQSRLEVIRPGDGQVVHEIIPTRLAGKYLTGVCYAGPDRLFVSTDDNNNITTLDFSGNVIQPGGFPSPLLLKTQGIEGLALLPKNVLAAANVFAGILALVGNDLRPRRLHYGIGVGLSSPSGLTWDTTTHQHLVCSFARFKPTDTKLISAVAPSLDSARQIAKTGATGLQLAYLPDEKLVAVTQLTFPTNASILLFDERGQQVERIDLDPNTLGLVFAFTYLPKTREFVVSSNKRDATLFVLSRQGAITRTINVASAGINKISSVAFNPAHQHAPLLITDRDTTRAVFVNLEGAKVGEFDVREKLQLLRPIVSTIHTGHEAGAFSAINSDNSELVVFRASSV
jgi:hypothetical protein